MTECSFVDTNILLRHLLGDNEQHSVAATQLIEEIATSARCAMLSATVVFETVYTLTKFYRLERDTVVRALRPILELDTVILQDKASVFTAFDLFATHRKLSFADCYHSMLSLNYCNGEIYTLDKDFDRIPDLTRLEPGV